MKKTLFFVTELRSFFEPVIDVVENWKEPYDMISLLGNLEAALHYLSHVEENEKCIMVTELLIPSQQRFESKIGPALHLAKEAKKVTGRNKTCFLIAYTMSPYLLGEVEKLKFDFVIDARQSGSHQILLNKLKELKKGSTYSSH